MIQLYRAYRSRKTDALIRGDDIGYAQASVEASFDVADCEGYVFFIESNA